MSQDWHFPAELLGGALGGLGLFSLWNSRNSIAQIRDLRDARSFGSVRELVAAATPSPQYVKCSGYTMAENPIVIRRVDHHCSRREGTNKAMLAHSSATVSGLSSCSESDTRDGCGPCQVEYGGPVKNAPAREGVVHRDCLFGVFAPLAFEGHTTTSQLQCESMITPFFVTDREHIDGSAKVVPSSHRLWMHHWAPTSAFPTQQVSVTRYHSSSYLLSAAMSWIGVRVPFEMVRSDAVLATNIPLFVVGEMFASSTGDVYLKSAGRRRDSWLPGNTLSAISLEPEQLLIDRFDESASRQFLIGSLLISAGAALFGLSRSF